MKSIEVRVGRFEKQHGGRDLTNKLCMKCVSKENRNFIYQLAMRAYDVATEKKQHTTMRTILDWWILCASHLEEIGRVLMSQRKVSDEDLEVLKTNSCAFVIHWFRMSKKNNPIYLKIHSLFCCIVPIAIQTRMVGKLATEGFENTHFFMKRQKAMLSRIVSDQDRCTKIMHRRQIPLIPGVADSLLKIEEATKRTGERGSYKNKSAKRCEENISIRHDRGQEEDDDDQEEDNEGTLMAIHDGMLLPKKFLGWHDVIAKKKVPAEFSQPFDADETLGSKMKHKSKYLEM